MHSIWEQNREVGSSTGLSQASSSTTLQVEVATTFAAIFTHILIYIQHGVTGQNNYYTTTRKYRYILQPPAASLWDGGWIEPEHAGRVHYDDYFFPYGLLVMKNNMYNLTIK
jgi:hypothetical protein